MSGLDDRLHGFRECRESGANEAQSQLRGKHFNTVIDKYWPTPWPPRQASLMLQLIPKSAV